MSQAKQNAGNSYIENELHFGDQKRALSELCRNYKKPMYVYDLTQIRRRFKTMSEALGSTRLYYAMKANSNLEVLRALKQAGSGVDVVSLGEVRRALEAGFTPQEMVYSGVGKTRHEITEALKLDLHQINVESLPELQRISEIAQSLGKKAQIALRLNPDVDIKTHPYIATGLKDNKFGIELSFIPGLKEILKSSPSLVLVGVSLHLGSQMLELSGFQDALGKLKKVFLDLQSEFSSLQRFDFGGGLGIFYDRSDEAAENKILQVYAQIVQGTLGDLKCELQSEPGRWLVAHAGILLTQVQYIKKTSAKTFLIVDTGMNHLIRPALYQAEHQILPVLKKSGQLHCDIVGPICESADFLAKDRVLTSVAEGDFMAILDAGAYGYSMANIYNLQELPEEIVL